MGRETALPDEMRIMIARLLGKMIESRRRLIEAGDLPQFDHAERPSKATLERLNRTYGIAVRSEESDSEPR
jgi:hypothetical protein